MSPQRISRIVISLTALLSANVPLGGADAAKPNVLIILADDLGYGDVQCYNPERGKIRTPHLDRLAREGMRFTDGHSSAAACTPSRYALLTGRSEVRNRMEGVGVFGGFGGPPLIPSTRLTIASLARQHGYRTVCIGKWHLGWEWPISRAERALLGLRTLNNLGSDYATPSVTADQLALWQKIFAQPIPGGPTTVGFDHYFGVDVPAWPPFCYMNDDRTVGVPSRFLPAAELPRDFSIAACQGPAVEDWSFVTVLPELVRHAVRTIATAADSTRPFLLYLPLPSPHGPWSVSDEWRGKSGLGLYGDWVAQTDDAVGQILRALEASGAARNTLVLFSSDNGFADPGAADLIRQGHYPSGPLRGYKASPYEGGHRVPFIVRWPGVVQPGRVCGQLVQQTDLLATLADIFGTRLQDDAGEDSFCFLPLLNGEDRPIRPHTINSSGQGAYALRHGDWKLILDTAGKLAAEVQLYNLADDLGETTDLAAAQPARVASMRTLLLKLVHDGRSTPGLVQPNDGKLVRFRPAN
jgi:arylsulfatase A-like enzyme